MTKTKKRIKPQENSLFSFMYEARTYTLLTLAEVVLLFMGIGALIRELSAYGGYSILGMCVFLIIYKIASKVQTSNNLGSTKRRKH